MTQAQEPRYLIGLMSGTSTDGADGVLAAFSGKNQPQILAFASRAMPTTLRAQLLDLNRAGSNELERASLASCQLADLYAQVVADLLAQTNLPASRIAAIGAHGQTVRHRPELGFTIQLNAPARLAENTGIAVVADFRSRDVAAGGQGAPLVPAFHEAIFASERTVTVLNLGGIANISILRPGQDVTGFDTGPANVLLDMWCLAHTGESYDKDGAWSAGGTVHQPLLEALIESEAWLALPPPKSTGRDLFNHTWLQKRLAGFEAIAPQDVQATLRAFTAETVAQAIRRYAADSQTLIVCGGGTGNRALLEDLQSRLPGVQLSTSDAHGIASQSMEALAFAWLAHAFLSGHPAGTPSVTGARRKTVLGCLYPA